MSKLDTAARNELIVDTWLGDREVYGQTIVFVSRKHQADNLAKLFKARDIRAERLHGDNAKHRKALLERFAAGKLEVLVTVQMVNEGVDIPSANTALLARPTTSRVLLRQMIGRVLRGPRNGGGEFAHIVHFNDRFPRFAELAEPPDVLDIIEVDGPDGRPRRPRHRAEPTDKDSTPIPYDVVNASANAYARAEAQALHSPFVGYYDIVGRRVGVHEHQSDAMREIERCPSSADADRIAATCREPRPTRGAVRALLDFSAEYGSAPVFVEITDQTFPSRVATVLLDGSSRTEQERLEFLRVNWTDGIAQTQYPNFREYQNAVQDAVEAFAASR